MAGYYSGLKLTIINNCSNVSYAGAGSDTPARCLSCTSSWRKLIVDRTACMLQDALQSLRTMKRMKTVHMVVAVVSACPRML